MTRQGTFSSLAIRNYRLFFMGQSVSVAGTWAQRMGQAWLVLELTGSGTLLGVTVALQHLPTLLMGLWGGLFADRWDKRRTLLASQSIAGVFALLLGVLTLTGVVSLWMVLVLAFALGAVESFDRPTRHTFVLEMVGADQLTNAITLHSILMNVGKTVGPALSGLLIQSVGISSSFLINALSYCAVVAGLLAMDRSKLVPAPRPEQAAGQIRESLHYVRNRPQLLGPLVVMLVAGMLTFSWNVTLPLLAHETFAGDARTFGLMFSAMGIGAVVGGLVVAGSLRSDRQTLVATGITYGVVIIAVALAPSLPIALALFLLVGGSNLALKALVTTHVQLVSAANLRGRVVALLAVATVGARPVGAPVVGWIAQHSSPRVALSVGGAATVLATLWTWSYLRRHLEPVEEKAQDDAPLAYRPTSEIL